MVNEMEHEAQEDKCTIAIIERVIHDTRVIMEGVLNHRYQYPVNRTKALTTHDGISANRRWLTRVPRVRGCQETPFS